GAKIPAGGVTGHGGAVLDGVGGDLRLRTALHFDIAVPHDLAAGESADQGRNLDRLVEIARDARRLFADRVAAGNIEARVEALRARIEIELHEARGCGGVRLDRTRPYAGVEDDRDIGGIVDADLLRCGLRDGALDFRDRNRAGGAGDEHLGNSAGVEYRDACGARGFDDAIDLDRAGRAEIGRAEDGRLRRVAHILDEIAEADEFAFDRGR